MPDGLTQGLVVVTQALEIVGAGALVMGFVIATVRWGLRAREPEAAPALEPYRQALGRVILIGLEVLVAATVIKTVTLEPNLRGVAQLVGTVAVRTILGWTTVLEMTGRWPWQGAAPARSQTATPQ